MKFFDRSAVMAIATGAIVFSACSHETDYYNPDLNPNKAQYEKNWKNTFGDINPEQDWNVAAKVTASVSLDGMQDAANIMVYTGLPGGLNSRLVAAYPAQTRTFSFDYEESAKDAYVLITDRNDRILLGNYFSIDNGKINIALNTRGTRAEDGCGTSLGEIIKTDNLFKDDNGYWPADLYLNQYNNHINYNKVFDLYKLNNVATQTGSSWKISDIVDIVGKGGVFNEGPDEKGECNLGKWEEDLKPSEGAEYVMEEDGPLEITFMYGGTEKFNKFGYICYKDGATMDEILRAPRYLLMDDARPQHNVTIDGTSMGEYGGMKLPHLVSAYESKYNGVAVDATLTGTTYKLAYFDENGNSSFTFPAGTHVVFFEVIGGNGWWDENNLYSSIRYSLPWMNKYFYHKRMKNHPNDKEDDAAQTFVTYRWNGQTVLGMEDSNDDDMNDILFFVNGKFKSHDIPDIGNDPAPQEWILACEDLGSTDDFDFNDVVFKVAHVSGQTEAEVTVLETGGIMPATIFCGDKEIGEAHSLLGVATDVMTTKSPTAASAPVKIEVPADFTMTENMGGFKIYVAGDETSVVSVNAPGKGEVPQIICVPGTWKWPKERVSISAAYPNFGEWGTNWQDNTWYNTCNENNVIIK